MRDLFISLPAWGDGYIDLVRRFAIPSILASLEAADYPANKVTFLIHTDQPDAFANLNRIECTVLHPKLANAYWWKETERFAPPQAEAAKLFIRAHQEAIKRAPRDSLLMLMNADYVLSIETIAAVHDALQGGKHVGASIGIRTLWDEATPPPLGASAETLAEFIWSHRHKVTDDCTWGTGATASPTTLFFVEGDAVVVHSFHQTPMFIVKGRDIAFNGTIDDDLMANYRDDEIVYFKKRDFIIAEMSPRWRGHPCGSRPVSIEDVVAFNNRHFSPSHRRNFRQQFVVRGTPSGIHPVASEIMTRLG